MILTHNGNTIFHRLFLLFKYNFSNFKLNNQKIYLEQIISSGLKKITDNLVPSAQDANSAGKTIIIHIYTHGYTHVHALA